jgi:hypothetical protein
MCDLVKKVNEALKAIYESGDPLKATLDLLRPKFDWLRHIKPLKTNVDEETGEELEIITPPESTVARFPALDPDKHEKTKDEMYANMKIPKMYFKYFGPISVPKECLTIEDVQKCFDSMPLSRPFSSMSLKRTIANKDAKDKVTIKDDKGQPVLTLETKNNGEWEDDN